MNPLILPTPFLCFGHRGAAGHEPENTLRSIRTALSLGAHGIEIDVRLASGHLVVIHDSTLGRTTNGHGFVARKSLDQLRQLDAGLGEIIPTLREVFHTVNRRALINIELKGPHTAAPVEALILEFIENHHWSFSDFLVSSFHKSQLRSIQDHRIPIGLLITRPSPRSILTAQRLRASSIHLALPFANKNFIDAAHQKNLHVFVYTVNHPHDIARLQSIGANGVFTDFPERALHP